MGSVIPRLAALALLVAAGATIGTGIRAKVEMAYPPESGEWPWATFLINVAGSLLLGVVLESLARIGDDTGWRQRTRLAVGTGVIGGFTTYSTFIVEIDQLARSGHVMVGASYALVSVVAGLLAAGLGVTLAGAAYRAGSADSGSH